MTKHLPPIRQGDDYKSKIAFPVGTDITGVRFFLTLKNDFEDPDELAVLQYTHTAGVGADDDAINGNCVFAVPAAVTATLPAGAYFYDLQAVFIAGDVVTLAPPIKEYKVKLAVIPQVTRAI